MIKYIKRLDPVKKTRFSFLRLDKNERISNIENELLNLIKKNLRSEHFTAYPEIYNFYNNLSKFHKLSPKNFLATSGIDKAIKLCIEVFSSEKKYVLILKPGFAMIDVYCKTYGRKIINIGYEKVDDEIKLNINLLLDKISKKINLIIISNPNSPTGTIIETKNIIRIIKKAKKNDIKVVIDEAYHGFTKLTVLNLIKKYNNLVVLRTFSKAYGLAGLRAGYIVSNYKNIHQLNSLRPMYEINSVGILAANTLVKNYKFYRKYLNEFQEGKKFFIKFLKNKNIKFLKTNANFILLQNIKNEKTLFKICKKKKNINS